MSDVTAADCGKLWQGANKYIPELASIYTGITDEFSKIPDDEAYRFNRKEATAEPENPATEDDVCKDQDAVDFPGVPNYTLTNGGTGPVYEKYVQLRAELDTIFSETVTNMHDTGIALNEAAWAYAETDGLNSGDLRDEIDLLEGYKYPDDSLVDENADPPDYNEPE